jgi:hypothetical protein
MTTQQAQQIVATHTTTQVTEQIVALQLTDMPAALVLQAAMLATFSRKMGRRTRAY